MAFDRERLNKLRRLKQLQSRAEIPQPQLTPSQQAVAGDQGFLSRVGEDLRGRVGEAEEIRRGFETGESGLASTALQRLGLGFGTGADILGEVAVSGFRAIPDPLEDILRKTGGAVGEFVGESALGQLAGRGIEAAGEKFAELDPNVQRNLRALGEVAPFAIPGAVVSRPLGAAGQALKGITKPIGKAAREAVDLLPERIAKPVTEFAEAVPTTVGEVGEKLVKAGEKQVAKRREAFLDDLVLPRQTAKQVEKQIGEGRVEEGGIFRGRKIELSPKEKAIAQEVDKLSEVISSKTLLNNNKSIQKAVDTKAKELVKSLEGRNVIFAKDEIKIKLNAEIEDILETEILLGDASIRNTAKRLLGSVDEIIEGRPETVAGVLQMRKDFDNKVRDTFGDIFKDDTKVKAMNVVNDRIRTRMNNFIEEKVPDVGVKKSLNEQHLLLKATDNITPKAARAAESSLGRIMQTVTNILPKSVSGKLLTIGGVGAGVGFMPKLLATAGVIGGGFLTVKALKSPVLKRALGETLKLTDTAIKKSTDPEILKQLKADRLVLVGIINQAKETGEE